MRAARIHAYGAPEVLQVDDAPLPVVGRRDVLIEVHAAAVNPIDWKIRRGYQRALIPYRLPQVLGLDASGVVVRIGRAVTRFSIGDEVFCSPTHRRSGTYAEFVAVDERAVAHKPKRLTHEEAAGIPLAGLTAYRALVEVARIGPGQRVLVQAGAGGVGSLAVQLAKHYGCEVAATCSGSNVKLVRELGADRVIDYGVEAYDEVLSDYDVVLDALGGEHKARYPAVLRRGGVVASIVNDVPAMVERHGPYLGIARALLGVVGHKLTYRRAGLRLAQVLRASDGRALAALARIIDDGGVRPLIDQVYELDDIVAAHRRSESGHARGKVIVRVR